MKQALYLLFFFLLLAEAGHGQISVSKQLGKNGNNAKLGYGVFAFYHYSLPNVPNQSICLEIADLTYYPRKDGNIRTTNGYLSIKGGYKYVFGEEEEGFYLEPSAGFCRVANTTIENNPLLKDAKNGFALALEAGYAFAVGQGNTINLGLKYEDDIAGKDISGADFTISSIALRVSYSFHLFGKRNN